MAALNPPFVVGQSNNTASSFRNVVSGVYGGTSGVMGLSDLTVSNTSPTVMSVAAGSAVIQGTHASYQGAYLVTNDAASSMTITPTGSGLRYDLVIARIRDKDFAVDSAYTEGWVLEFIVGATHATTPVEPTLVTVAPTGGASTFLVLARITVNTSGYVASSIVDRRKVASPTAGPTITTTALLANNPATVGTEGNMVYDTTASKLLINDGGSTPAYNPPWNLPWGVVASTAVGAGSQTGITTTATDVNIGSVAMALSYASVLSTRRYRVVARLSEVSCSAAATVELRLLGGLTTATTQYGRSLLSQAIVGDAASMTLEATVSGLTSGTWAWKVQVVRATGSGTVTVGNTLLQSSAFIYLEDVGPAANPA